MRKLLFALPLLALPLAACGDDDSGASDSVSQADQASDQGDEIWPQDMGGGMPGANPHGGMPGANPHGDMGGTNPHGGGMMGDIATGAPSQPPSPTGSAGGVHWEAPEAFHPAQTSSNMRVAQYEFGAEGQPTSEMVVYYFGPGQGGSVDANVRRWVGQFTQPDGRDSMEAASIEQKQVNGLDVTTVDVSGTFSAGMGPGQAGGNQRMLAAIATGAQGPVFFKMVGPADQMQAALPAFQQLVQSFQPAGQGAQAADQDDG